MPHHDHELHELCFWVGHYRPQRVKSVQDRRPVASFTHVHLHENLFELQGGMTVVGFELPCILIQTLKDLFVLALGPALADPSP